MQRFSKHFEREDEGVFRCVTPATFPLPNGQRIEVAPRTVLTRGTSFMSIDLAAMLEAYYQRTTRH